jgi:hypothetical protein
MSVWAEFCLWRVALLPNFVTLGDLCLGGVLKLMLGGLHGKHKSKREFETELSIRSITEENHTKT